MKTLIIGLIMLLGANDSSTKNTEDYSWVLDEMDDLELFEDLDLKENQIKIFDLEGNLVGVYSEEKFIENELSLKELRLILNSDFLFESDGESYYLKG